MKNEKLKIPYKKIRVIQFIFKRYLDPTTAKKYYTIVNVFKETGDEHLFNFIRSEIKRIKQFPNFEPDELKY